MRAQTAAPPQARHDVPRTAKADSRFNRTIRSGLAGLGAALFFLASAPALAVAVAPTLGDAQNFAVLGASTVTNTGATVVTGNLGLSPGAAITGFPPGSVIGTTHQTDAAAASAQAAATTAYNALTAQACDAIPLGPTDLAGATLAPGVHCYSSSMEVSTGGTLTLDAGGNPNAVWVFKTGSTFKTISNASIVFKDGIGQACNVFWQVGSSATLGTDSNVVGTIIAAHDITLATRAAVSGRVLARGVAADGAVTLDTNAVTLCSLAATTPTVGKAFNLSTIDVGGVSTLTITLSNPNPAVANLTAAFIDTFPAGVVIAPTPNAATTCGGGGALVATAGGTSVTLPAGRTIPANGSCTLTADVTAAAAGSYINNLPINALVTSNGNNAAAAVATLTVNPLVPSAPTLGKAFSPASVNTGVVSRLTITLSNPNGAVALLNAVLTDTLPAGVVIAATPDATTTCGGVGAPIAVAGGTTVSLPALRSIPANGSCTLSVNVRAAVAGSYINTLLAGALVTSNGNNAAPALATLTTTVATVPYEPPPPPVLPPTLGKAFIPSIIGMGDISTFVIILRNPHTTNAILTSALIDTLPNGVVLAPTPNVATNCSGTGTPVAVAGSSTVTLPAGRSIPANGSCMLRVDVTSAVAGYYTNTLPTGILRTTNGNNVAPANAILTVSATPVIPPVIPPVVPPVVPIAAPNSIPTLSEWGMILLTSLLAITGFAAMRRQPR